MNHVAEKQYLTFFAYPFEVTEPDAEAFVSELFPMTVVTKFSKADLQEGFHQLPRITVTMESELTDILY